MDPEQIQFHIEQKYLECILKLTEVGDMSNNLAQLTAQVMQTLRPWHDWDDACTKTEFFVSKFPSFTVMYEYAQSAKREADTSKTIAAMHEQLQNNNIDEALKIAQSHNGT